MPGDRLQLLEQPFDAVLAVLLGYPAQQVGAAGNGRNLPPLKTHYEFNDREVEFFAIHIEADEVHGERGYQIVERHCVTDAMKDEALDQVRQAAEMRWQYMSGLYRAFVAKEDL